MAPKPSRVFQASLPPRLLAAVLLLFVCSGCASWRQELRPVPEIVAEKPAPTRRVNTVDGASVEICRLHLAGDTLVGGERFVGKGGKIHYQERRIPLGTITGVETQVLDSGKTLRAIVGVAAGAALVAMIVWGATDFGPRVKGSAFLSGGISQASRTAETRRAEPRPSH